MNARAIIEAETPKKGLQAAARRRLKPILLKSRFVPPGCGFKKEIKHHVTGQLLRYTVWYDHPSCEWVVKREHFAPGRRVWIDDYEAFKSEENVIGYLKTLDYVLEAETPKKAIRASQSAEQFLRSAGFEHVSMAHPDQWSRETGETKVDVYKGDYENGHHWIVNTWHLEHVNDDGVEFTEWQLDVCSSYPDFKSVKKGVVSGIYEAETPKKAMRAVTDPNNLDALLKRIQREEEIEATPHADSWQPGQRVRRIRHGAFGPRPYGGNPNDIGDTGTITRFFRRLPEPAHAEYSVVWDRHQLGFAETDHRHAEAIPGEFDQLDQWGRPPVRRAH